MVQLRHLSGAKASESVSFSRFPISIGRGADCGLVLSEPGVWEQHCELRFDRSEGFSIHALGEAILHVNGNSVPSARLRNGDQLELGGARLQFWLSPTRQKSVAFREAVFWCGLALLATFEWILIWWLLS